MKRYDGAHQTDVLVFGAGPAGIAAAVAAARRRQSVCLIEHQNVVGGVKSCCPGMMQGSGYPCGTSIGGFFEEFVGRLYDHDPPLAERRACDSRTSATKWCTTTSTPSPSSTTC